MINILLSILVSYSLLLKKSKLDSTKSDFWFNQSFVEKLKKKTCNSLTKIIKIPLIVFSDDTSEKKLKKFNLFDSHLMTPAALLVEERSSDKNHFFIISNKALSDIDMILSLAADLCSLVNGIEICSGICSDHCSYSLYLCW
jgi:hypothetical protein